MVELLVVISIVALLSTLMLGALYTAQDAAKVQKTRSTIAKLHLIAMDRYEAYQTRRVPIQIDPNEVSDTNGNGTIDKCSNDLRFKFRLDALRELMRLEMPDRFSDITRDPITYAHIGANGLPVGNQRMSRSSVSQSMLRKITAAPSGYDSDNERAECFYLWIVAGSTSEDSPLEGFGESEIKDTDRDGLPEFVDAWDKPIRFLRWAPGFPSELQKTTDPDPFDSRKVYPRTGQMEATFALYPLIYSGGPDMLFDIYAGDTGLAYADYNNNPFRVHPDGLIGSTIDIDGDGELTFGDNIHNHLIGAR